MRLGPEELGGRSVVAEITVRRYRCLRCSAVMMVCPRGVLPRLRYGAVAIALALGLWAVEGQSSSVVRSQVSPFAVLGHDARRGWRSLARWARGSPWAVQQLALSTSKEMAARTVQHLAGHASGTGSLVELACAGALLA